MYVFVLLFDLFGFRQSLVAQSFLICFTSVCLSRSHCRSIRRGLCFRTQVQLKSFTGRLLKVPHLSVCLPVRDSVFGSYQAVCPSICKSSAVPLPLHVRSVRSSVCLSVCWVLNLSLDGHWRSHVCLFMCLSVSLPELVHLYVWYPLKSRVFELFVCFSCLYFLGRLLE